MEMVSLTTVDRFFFHSFLLAFANSTSLFLCLYFVFVQTIEQHFLTIVIMYGLINNAIADFVRGSFGDDTWDKIWMKAGTASTFLSMDQYSDQVTYALVGAASEVLGLPATQVLETFGEYWINYTFCHGYKRLLDMHGTNFTKFLENLNAMHTNVQASYPDLHPPSFWCTEVTETSLTFHYKPGKGERVGLAYLVIGLIKGLAKHMKMQTVEIKQIKHRDSEGADHDEFEITWDVSERHQAQTPAVTPLHSAPEAESYMDPSPHGSVMEQLEVPEFILPPSRFCEAFPFHMVLSKDLILLQRGQVLKRVCPGFEPGSFLQQHWEIKRPSNLESISFDNISANSNTVFILKHKDSVLELKGQMMCLQSHEASKLVVEGGSAEHIYFLGSPFVTTSHQAAQYGLTLDDFAIHDPVKDIIFLTATNDAVLNDAHKMEEYIFFKLDRNRLIESQQTQEVKKTKSLKNTKTKSLKSTKTNTLSSKNKKEKNCIIQ